MNKDILAGLIFGAAMLGLALAAKAAHTYGYVDANAPIRVIAMNGLLIAYFGNGIPKKVAPHAVAQKAMRVSGWSMVLSGLVYAGLWAFAPIPAAVVFGTGAAFAGVLFTLGYCVWVSRQARTHA